MCARAPAQWSWCRANVWAAVVGGRPPRGMVPVSAPQFYRYLARNTPLQHRPSYHLATDLLAREGEAYSRVLLRAAPPDGALAGVAGVLFPPALDACTHPAILPGPIPPVFFFPLPVSYGRMFVWPAAGAAALAWPPWEAPRCLPAGAAEEREECLAWAEGDGLGGARETQGPPPWSPL